LQPNQVVRVTDHVDAAAAGTGLAQISPRLALCLAPVAIPRGHCEYAEGADRLRCIVIVEFYRLNRISAQLYFGVPSVNQFNPRAIPGRIAHVAA
jgi:hypothetical protein